MFDLSVIGAGLPVLQRIDQLAPLLDDAHRAVIQAPPGTGKTTLVPPAVFNAVGGRVIVVAPRRVAVRAAAARLSALSGLPIGYAVRGASRPSKLVEFLTPGVLLRRLLHDPFLEGVSAVVLDEVHERGLDTDLVLGMLLELTELREDLALVAMSATIDASRFATLLGDAPILETPALTHPLDIRYQPIPGRLAGKREFYAELARLAASHVGPHSVLVFVPGVREVNLVCSAIDAIPLHGRLSPAEQDAALSNDSPRVVVATNVAESSLTVPGVRVVIDSGLARVPRRDRARGMTGLLTSSIAQSSADQRAGRAGREGPGLVIRAYSAAEYAAFQPFSTPEILSADLTQAALFMHCWGSLELPLLDQPPAPALADAEAALRELGALAPNLTDLGRQLAALPLEPRLGRALLATGDVATVALLSDQPSGDISRGHAPAQEVRRLSSLVSAGPRNPGLTTALAYPEWIGHRVGPDTYLLASGTRATCTDVHDEWIACAAVTRSATGGVIRAATALPFDDVLAVLSISEEDSVLVEDGKIKGVRVRRVGAIPLSSTPVRLESGQVQQALANAVRSSGLEILRLSADFTALRERLAFLHEHLGAPWPDVSDAALQDRVCQWLGTSLEIGAAALQPLLPWPEASRLAELAPERLQVTSGNTHRLHYDTGRPVCQVKLQECFGLDSSPEVCGVKVQFHLLSPAGRPLAVTDDLASFWSGPYAGVRADMRGRYPKHPWPEDPWTAPATARTKKRSR
ncbi:ATP-dependent helicase C-terminal domain-containing protein [Corynebacterium sp. H127]|uniref:ATP-dependent RNA helicase n=1 Tax=Corynebacterium sp. H127 TaxID=3133418 RepID=UPI0030A8B594